MNQKVFLDRAFIDRLRNAAFLEQLYRLRRGDEHRGASAHYNSVTCTLALFEILMSRGSLAEELTREDLARAFFPFLTQLDNLVGVQSNPHMHAEYLDDLIDSLAPGVKLEAEYVDPNHENPMRRVPFVFLRFKESTAGKQYLELSAEATNIYLGMLTRDVESIQRASEYLLDENIRRGHIQAAVLEARTARNASESYHQELLNVIRRTQRDVHSVDWRANVPELLERAVRHVGERIEAESSISARVRAQLDTDTLHNARGAQEERELLEKRALLAQILDTVDETQRLHGQLLRVLNQTRKTYFEAQDEQFILPRGGPGSVDIVRDVLDPLLRGSAARAVTLTASLPSRFFPNLGVGLNLAHLIEHLATPKRAVARPAFEVMEREIEPFEYGLERYTRAERDRAFHYLRGEGVRLSEAVGRARDESPAVRQLIVLLAYQGYCGLGFHGQHEGLTSDVSGLLDAPNFSGDDLIVTAYQAKGQG